MFDMMTSFCLKNLVSWSDLMAIQNRSHFCLCSNSQFALLISSELTGSESLLDIGSGTGSVLKELAPNFKEVHCFEISSLMKFRLSLNGFRPMKSADYLNLKPKSFDYISLLNVMDVTSDPQELIKNCVGLAREGVLVSVPLPYRQKEGFSREYNSESKSFEFSVNSFLTSIESQNGIKLISWSKVPYLDESICKSDFPIYDNIIALFQTY
jgi:SAM-dependent methyltransferase